MRGLLYINIQSCTMFIYLMHIPQGSCKIGLTTRFPMRRLKECITICAFYKIYAVAYMPSITNVSALEDIERNCLVATIAYHPFPKELPENECRYGIEPDKLWEMCRPYFPADAIEYFGSHAERLTTQDCPTVKPTAYNVGPEPLRYLFRSYAELMAHRLPDLRALCVARQPANITQQPAEQLMTLITNTVATDVAHQAEQIAPDEQQHITRAAVVLRGYQPAAYAELLQAMSTYGMATLNIMCRCGKTELFKKYAVDFQNAYEIIIYCAPRLPLITEIIARFEGHLPQYVILELSSQNSRYAVRDDAAKLAELGNKRCLIFVCDKSFARVVPYINTGRPTLVIFDEAHYLCGPKHASHPLNIVQKYRDTTHQIFATATPKYRDWLTDKSQWCLNDPEYFPNRLETTVTFTDISKAIAQQFMTEVVLVIKDSIENERFPFLEGRLSLAINLFESIREKLGRRKALFYCNSIKSVERCFTALKQCYGDMIELYKLSCDMSEKTREEHLDKFRKTKALSIMVNCRMLTDGINIVDLDTVVYVDPKYEKTDIIQSSMRPRSYMPNKTACLVIPCSANNKLSDNVRYRTCIDIITTLEENNDPSVIKLLSSCKNTRGPQRRHIIPDTAGHITYVHQHIAHQIIRLTGAATCKTYMPYTECVLAVQSDHIPRQQEEIDMYIAQRRFNTTVPKSSAAVYSALVRTGKLHRTTTTPHMYYVPMTNMWRKMPVQEFIAELKDRDIYTEQDYREYFMIDYTRDFPPDPCATYTAFRWADLEENTSNYYPTIEECRAAIDILLSNPLVNKQVAECGDYQSKKIICLNAHDRRIPINILTIYNIDYYVLHSCFRGDLLERTR